MIRPKRPMRSSPRTSRWARPPDNSWKTSWKESEMARSNKSNGEGRGRGGFKSSRHGKASAAGPKAQQKLAAEEREKKGEQHTAHETSRFLKGQRIDPRRIDGKETVAELIEGTYLAYNAAHFGLGLAMHRGNAQESDVVLREEGVVRIYDIFFDYDVLLSTDAFFRKIIGGKEFQRSMSSAEFHNLAGKYVREREKALGIGQKSLLSAAYSAAVPIYTSSPGDSSIGMNIAALALDGNKLLLDPNRDVNETASIVLDAKRGGGKSGVMILGGGSPKNFMLQTEPQIQEVLGIDEKGHDYFLQITDARPDTGGLSGATPAEAVSWGKIDPDAHDRPYRFKASAAPVTRVSDLRYGSSERSA